MANSTQRPVIQRQGLKQLQQDVERSARGPKDITGDKRQWTQHEVSGALKVQTIQAGKPADALFDPTRGEWFT